MYRKKNVVIITMCIAVLLMIVGYAAFSTSLKINGTGKITSVWDIYFESVTLSSTVGTASEASSPTISNTSISFNINLRKPGDKVVYKAVLKNAGTVDAKVSEINAEAKGTAAIINTVTGIKKGDTVSAGTSTTITITVEYDKTITTVPSITTNELTINIECIQPDQNVTSENLVVYQPTLKVASTTSGATQPFLGGPIAKNTIESITFTNTKTVPSGVKGSWDVSSNSDGKVMAWYADSDSDSLYEVVIGQDGGVIANPDTSRLFYYCTNVTNIDFSYFDTSLVTNMSKMFSHAKVTTLDLSGFETTKVTNMSGMFHDCQYLSSLNLKNFNTSRVTDMAEMFYNCILLLELDLNHFDTSKVTSMYGMFYLCKKLTNLEISNFDTSKVTSMIYMFSNCESLTELNLHNFDTSKVTNMSYMFQYCYALDNLNLDGFNTAKVTTMERMFCSCRSIKNIDLSSFDTSNVNNMSFLFAYCYALEEIDLSSFTTNKVTTISKMFIDCVALKSIDLSSFDTSNVKAMLGTFSGCRTLTNLDISNFVTSQVTTMEEMFYLCENLRTLNMDKAKFGTVTTYTNMFTGAYSTMTITVKSSTEQTWILDKLSTANVVVA